EVAVFIVSLLLRKPRGLPRNHLPGAVAAQLRIRITNLDLRRRAFVDDAHARAAGNDRRVAEDVDFDVGRIDRDVLKIARLEIGDEGRLVDDTAIAVR